MIFQSLKTLSKSEMGRYLFRQQPERVFRTKNGLQEGMKRKEFVQNAAEKRLQDEKSPAEGGSGSEIRPESCEKTYLDETSLRKI